MATLTVTHTENIVLEGRQQGSSKTMIFNDIVDVYSRVYKFKQGTLTSLYTTHADTISGGVFDNGSIKYVRISNLGADPIVLNIINETNETHQAIELEGRKSFYLYSHYEAIFADDSDDITTAEMAHTGTAAGLNTIEEIKAYSQRSPAKVEVFIASTEATA